MIPTGWLLVVRHPDGTISPLAVTELIVRSVLSHDSDSGCTLEVVRRRDLWEDSFRDSQEGLVGESLTVYQLLKTQGLIYEYRCVIESVSWGTDDGDPPKILSRWHLQALGSGIYKGSGWPSDLESYMNPPDEALMWELLRKKFPIVPD